MIREGEVPKGPSLPLNPFQPLIRLTLYPGDVLAFLPEH